MLFTVEVIEELQKIETQLRDVFIKVFKAIENTIGEVVKREDFIELKREFQTLATLVKELAKAQKRTEKAVEELTHALKETRQMVGNLSDTVGYTLKDRAMKALPAILFERFGINIKERLVRKYIQSNGK
ncbi:MAG: hypothetical protein N2042_03405 [Thermodesulfovibrio sp.]|nr:hypothetical protein [Thermodesulfovibrio sp.]